MAVYSTNQNRQLYVANGVSATFAGIQGTSNLGKVFVGTDADGNKFINQNGYGGIIRSDLLNPKKIMWATASGPKDTEIKLKAVTLSLNSDFNNGAIIPGEDYIVRVNFRQMYGMSDEDIYQKYGAVHATSAMATTPAKFYKAMIYSLMKNFSRVYAPMLEIGVNSKSNIVAKATKDSDGTVHLYNAAGTEIDTTATAIYIAEKSQISEWALGTKQYTPVYFEVVPTTVITSSGEEGIWGTVAPVTGAANLPDPVGNGYKFADLEYFCMGERGDQYRNIMWPKSIPTSYFVVPTNTYYCLDIHYAYQGTCEDIQKSEKTMTIISTTKKDITDIIDALGIGDKVQETDLFDGTASNAKTYPSPSIEDRLAALETP